MYANHFSVNAGPTARKQGKPFTHSPTEMRLALFTNAPAHDGTGFEEPDGTTGYSRRRVTFGPISTNAGLWMFRNLESARFNLALGSDSEITHAGLFDEEDHLLFFSWLQPVGVARAEGVIAFDPSAIQLRCR